MHTGSVIRNQWGDRIHNFNVGPSTRLPIGLVRKIRVRGILNKQTIFAFLSAQRTYFSVMRTLHLALDGAFRGDTERGYKCENIIGFVNENLQL